MFLTYLNNELENAAAGSVLYWVISSFDRNLTSYKEGTKGRDALHMEPW